MKSKYVNVDPEIHSGTPVFAGTRVPIKTLFDHLEAGDSLEVFLADFPSVSRSLAVAVLEDARRALDRRMQQSDVRLGAIDSGPFQSA